MMLQSAAEAARNLDMPEIALPVSTEYDDVEVHDKALGVIGEAYLAVVQQMLHAAASGASWQFTTIVYRLAELATAATGADVGYVRRAVGHEWMELMGGEDGIHWRIPVADRWGRIPVRKHIKDCFNGEPERKFGLGTLGTTSCHSRDKKLPTIGQYSPEETKYLKDLGSVAIARLGAPEEGTPRFLLFLGHRSADFLAPGSKAMFRLKQIQPLLDAAFRLAEGVQDRFDKAQRLKNLSEALPPLAFAETDKAFWRGVATILTSGPGFGFDRAMIFRWRGGGDKAECCMAIGGMSGEWADARNEVAASFSGRSSLLTYVQDALAFPEPGTGCCKLKDPLYEEVCKVAPLVFDRHMSTAISSWLASVEQMESPGLEAQPAKPISSADDDWVRQVSITRPGIFFANTGGTWPNDEYFVLPLMALDPKGNRVPIGFVLADVCYAPSGHVPGMDMPDLEITSTVLHLIAGMWHARQQEEAYFHTLGAMRAVRHFGDKVSFLVDDLKHSLSAEVASEPKISTLLISLCDAGNELGKAKRIVEGIQDKRLNSGSPTNPAAVMREAGIAAKAAYPGLEFTVSSDPTPIPHIPLLPWNGEFTRIPSESLRQILDCILENAGEFARINSGDEGKATVRGGIRLVEVSEEGQERPGRRVLLTLENDGPPIAPGLAPFLFTDGVSTRRIKGHGTGLSTARQIAKAYRGDVLLLNIADPVVFGVVLHIAATPPNLISTH
jgi:hypothetical protein